MSDLWPSFKLSGEIALSATLLTALIGVPLAFWMARLRFFGKSLVEALIMMPLVLPPTVVGYLLLLVLGARGWPGSWLKAHDLSPVFTIPGAVIASFVVALPMLYMPAKAAFQDVDRELEDIAHMMGANPLQLFWHVSLPMARRGILSGALLAFARALGEFGATAMVYGMHEKDNPLPIAIFNIYEGGDTWGALPAVIVLGVTSFVVMLLYNRWIRVQK